jgi:hypothetical protein
MRSYRILLIMAVLLAMAGVHGCSCNEGGQAAKDLNLSYDPLSIDFGSVAIGQEAYRVVTLTHVGSSGTIELMDLSIDSRSAEFSLEATEVRTLEPGQSTVVTVWYRPIDSTSDAGELVIQNNIPPRYATRIPITVSGVFADIGAIPNPIDFGMVSQGQVYQLDVILKNFGSDRVTLKQIYLDIGGSLDFAIEELVTSDGSALPVTLEPGGQMGLVMRYAPTGGGSDSSYLYVEGETQTGAQTWPFDVEGSELGPRLVATPGVIDFQWVPLNETHQRLVLLENDGNANLDIAAIGTTPGSDADIRILDPVPSGGETLAPGESRDLLVSWTAKTVRPDSMDPIGMLSVESNDPTSPTLIHVFGRVDAPVVQVIPEVVDFGYGAKMLPVERQVTIRNNGHGTLKVQPLEIVDADTTYGQEFTFKVDPKYGPNAQGIYEIQGNSGIPVVVTFTNKGPATGNTSAKLRVRSNSPGSETVDVRLMAARALAPECKLNMVPTALNFGTVPVGFFKELPINFVNTGSGACGFKDARIEDCIGMMGTFVQCMEPGTSAPSTAYRFMSLLPRTPNAIPAGQTVSLRVRFSPKVANTMFGELTAYPALLSFRAFDPVDNKEIRIPAQLAPGSMYQPNINGASGIVRVSILPNEVDFGLVTIGCYSQTHKVCVYNGGSAPLSITDIKMVGCTPEFRVKNRPALPKDVTAAAPLCFDVVYVPQDLGRDECVLQVASNDQASPQMSIGMKGEGTYETGQIDEFVQTSGQAVDILFVIDDSGSMCEEQDRMIKNFNEFIQHSQVWNNDYHIGFASVNVTQDAIIGRLNRGDNRVSPRYITPNAKAGEQLATLAKFGCDGGSDSQEAGLQAAQAALSAPLTTDTGVSCSSDDQCRNDKNICSKPEGCPYVCKDGTCGGYNKGFLRADAQLELVMLADEEDQSTGTVPFYIDFFRSLKGYYNSNMIHVHSIVGVAAAGASSCTSPDGTTNAGAGRRYIEVSDQTNGKVGSICDPDFSQVMNDIGEVAFGLKVQFFLTRLADPPTIEVTVAGKSCTTGWRFDAPMNSVIFEDEGPCMPQPGDAIRIKYETICLKS